MDACKAEEQKLRQENDKLKDTVRYLKERLVEAEVRNGGTNAFKHWRNWSGECNQVDCAIHVIRIIAVYLCAYCLEISPEYLGVCLVAQVPLPAKGSVKTVAEPLAAPVVQAPDAVSSDSPSEPPAKQAKKKEKKKGGDAYFHNA